MTTKSFQAVSRAECAFSGRSITYDALLIGSTSSDWTRVGALPQSLPREELGFVLLDGDSLPREC